ncbi:MAG: copper resistance protein B [Candidatus Binataceae bacterium]|nr:copper resistance protein B [Candidatus Binataceae bacterium]
MCAGSIANAQLSAPGPAGPIAYSPGPPTYTQDGEPPVEDNTIFYHLMFDQLEGRTSGIENEFRWDGEGWIGTDMNRLWFKSEGFLENGKVTDGDTEALYDRPIPHLRYFDVQAGVRYDLDSNPGRTWGAIGIEGLAPYWFQAEPTFYFSNDGRFAGRFFGSYDLLITNRLIAQPEIETNVYSKSEPVREIGSGLADLDTGLRIRYEFSRKFAPYIGAAYTQSFGETAALTRAQHGIVHDLRFIVGVRIWY